METFWAFQRSKKEFCAFNTKRQSYILPSTFSLLKRKAEHFYCCGGQKSGKSMQQKYQNKKGIHETTHENAYLLLEEFSILYKYSQNNVIKKK